MLSKVVYVMGGLPVTRSHALRRHLTGDFLVEDSRRMGRPPLKMKTVSVMVRLSEDMPGRIDAQVGEQKRSDFIRGAPACSTSRRAWRT